jgi:hypothetical protein
MVEVGGAVREQVGYTLGWEDIRMVIQCFYFRMGKIFNQGAGSFTDDASQLLLGGGYWNTE